MEHQGTYPASNFNPSLTEENIEGDATFMWRGTLRRLPAGAYVIFREVSAGRTGLEHFYPEKGPFVHIENS
ncbi:MAG TPA: hypothetical protein VI451_01535 [Anaerolineales bacterium]|nr:hypothetical protein [Anaerolineales bacterium]